MSSPTTTPEFRKVVTENDGKFQGYLTLLGKKVIGTDRESGSKIGIGSILGSLIKSLDANTVETSDETDPTHTPEKPVPTVSGPNHKPVPKEQQIENYIKSLHGKVSETIQISGVQVHIIDSHWSSTLKFEHKEVSYSLEILSPSEIFVSRTTDPALGVCYFDQQVPKLIDWMQSGLNLEDSGHTIHEREKHYKSHMIIWNFNNYKILATLRLK